MNTAVDTDRGHAEATGSLARCLVPLLDALGWRGDHGQLAEALPYDPGEMSLVQFLNTMANLRFESHEFVARLDQVDDSVTPCLFVGADGHAKVLVRPSATSFLAYDGVMSRYIEISRQEEEGTVFVFKLAQGMNLLQSQTDWFAKVLMRFQKLFIHALVFSLVLSLLALISPLFIMSIYSQMTAIGSVATLVFWMVGIAVYILANAGFRMLRAYLMGFSSVRIGNIVGNQVLRRLLYLPPSFTEEAPLSSQVSRIRDFETVRDFFSGPAATSLLDLMFILLLMVALVAIGGVVAYVPLTAILLFVAFGFVANQIGKRVNAEIGQSGSQKQEFLLEMLTNLMAVKYTGNRKRWLERYRALSADAAMGAYRSSRVNAVINTVSHVLVSGAIVATVGVGTMGVISGRMTLGALMACIFLVLRILSPLRSGFVVIAQIDKIRRSIVQLNRFMAMPLENRPETSMTLSKDISGAVSFSQVSLRYTTEAFPALLNVSFDVAQGESLVIVGHEGAGTSTILKLILGMYVPQVGRVLVDNTNVRQLDPILLRRSIAYVPEVSHLFQGTVAENLRLAHPAAGDDEMRQAAERAGILPGILSLPDAFKTQVDLGMSGQFTSNFVKRLTLARAFLRKSNLLILDRPEDGLNATAWLTEALGELKGSTTTLMVTQNTDLCHVADKMLWLDRGRVRMFGPAADVRTKYQAHLTQ